MAHTMAYAVETEEQAYISKLICLKVVWSIAVIMLPILAVLCYC